MLTARNLCFFLGALVVVVVFYSSTSLPSSTAVPAAKQPYTFPSTPAQDEQKQQTGGQLPEDFGLPTDTGTPYSANPLPVAGDAPPEVPAAEPAAPIQSHGEFNEMKFSFQDDLKFANPDWDVHHLKKYKPHNYEGAGRPTIATYLSTRNGTLHDPYFQAAQQLVYRVLWDPRSRSKKYPLTVFVAPFIEQEKRDILTAAGAIVKELELVDWQPTVDIWGRWKDLFSKLNIWGETEFSRVLFLDLDAFPVQNIDDIFDLAERQKCRKELLPVEDEARVGELCDYVFAGTEISDSKEINVGVMVLEPNKAMQQRLLREAKHTENFDNGMAEQAFLNYVFGQNSAFPTQLLDREWNGFFPQEEEEGYLKIIHEKLWSMNDHWAQNYFSDTWREMLLMYEGKEFLSRRRWDGEREFE
ncbi:glycosyltransferase family 8 protein [Zasmidium cellare ATCC 36951]|uniref:Glycosyltransferase family 8 protein n=1 Tax=Zasmidium cellare ATCC 36951 TaxID=1080233 RepID=A0A6A6C8A9_ZASCE|nr:glycosyltransferase family 8 protein [Zasmidium cellare ATCC 36951]KAF2163271.1 glycosyltransferase family 8 protein [Zasmidium cellare ATCC 36951]